MRKQLFKFVSSMIVAAGMTAVFSLSAFAAECSNRGDLDVQYCDENSDMLADKPSNS